MAVWVYKCNARDHSDQSLYGDWDDVFERGGACQWGSTEWVPALDDLESGDVILAYQTNRNELVGVVSVSRKKKRKAYLDIYLKPIEEIRVKVRPLKKENDKIAAIPAFKPGPIKTIYEISVTDARRLLKAAGADYSL